MGQLTRSVSVTSGHSATYTVYGVEITEREDDRGNYDSWEENYTFAVTSGSPASRLDSYDRYNGEVSESMTSKEKSFTLLWMVSLFAPMNLFQMLAKLIR